MILESPVAGWRYGTWKFLKKPKCSCGAQHEVASPQRERLCTSGVQCTNRCVHCEGSYKNDCHVFFGCNKVEEVWAEARLWNFIHDKLEIAGGFVDRFFFFFNWSNCCPMITYICLLWLCGAFGSAKTRNCGMTLNPTHDICSTGSWILASMATGAFKASRYGSFRFRYQNLHIA